MENLNRKFTPWERSFYHVLHHKTPEEIAKLGNFFSKLDKVYYFGIEGHYYDVKKNKWPVSGSCVTSVDSLYFVDDWFHYSRWLETMNADEIIQKYCETFGVSQEVTQKSLF